jgi:hypothetical protein
MPSCNLLDDFLSHRHVAEETLLVLRDTIGLNEIEHAAMLAGRPHSNGTYSLSRQGDALARICQLRNWASMLSDQLSGR